MSDIKVKIHQLEDNFIQFSISNIHIGLANAIRRIMIAEVPTMAIDFARIMQNSGCIHDDMIAQRIGLIPFVSTNVDKFDYYWNNSEGLSEVEYELNIINTGDEIIEVTSNDLKIKNVNNYTGYIKNIYKSVTVVDMGYPIVITKLAKGQQLYFICSVRKGISQEHAKFQPTSSVGYEILPDNEFLFKVETVGSLTPSEVIEKTFDIFNSRCNNILKNL
jgi:DNA-directed RNA polymerase II subunit RPB3